MNWISVLNDLYEKKADIAGKVEIVERDNKDDQKLILLPVSHLTVTAQIEVTIDGGGNFIRANTVDKNDAVTIIPVTEESGSRTSSPAPHPLCDNLKYIAGDYMKLINLKSNEDTEKKDVFKKNYEPYIAALEKWCNSGYKHPKAVAILKYLKKAELIKDLISNNVLQRDESGQVSDKIKIQNISQEDSFIRFRVETVNESSSEEIIANESGRFSPEVWLDRTLQRSYIEYYKSIVENNGFCYLTGETTQIGELHPKKIRNEGDGAKLISANDSDSFTFRGRFNDKNQAISIGYERSQKAHNALKWIIRKQGYTRDGLCVVIWESDLKPIISPFDDTIDIADSRLIDDESESTYDTNYISAKKFNAALEGFKTELDNSSKMVIMAFDAATPGRLSITYFKEFESSSYLENIKCWHNSCSWMHERTKNNKLYKFEGMASLKDIASALYGTEQNGMLVMRSNDGKTPMMISTFNRLLPCITERKKIPNDVVKIAVLRASSPTSYEVYNWKKILSIACSLVKKQRFEKYKEEWTMSLNNESHDRNYLYGRLLSVAERIEYLTYDRNENRETNAKRYMNAFSQRPFRTWKIIEEKIQPYLNKLSTGQKIYYSKMMDEIYAMFDEKDFSNDGKLDGIYLLGYHCQSFAFEKNKINNLEEENEE